MLVQPVDDTDTAFPHAYRRAQETARTVGLAVVYECDDKQAIGSQVLFSDNEILASNASISITTDVAESSTSIIHSRVNCNLQFDSLNTRIFCEVINPNTRLAIFGAGDDVTPLLTVARSIGIESHIIDSRRSYLERFRETENVHYHDHGFDPSVVIDAPEHTAIVIMSHNFELDKRFLTSALATDCAYIGVMGSRKRTLRMLAELGREEACARIKFPIGLDLGAESPEEIALSVCSEILAFFRKASGKPLSSVNGPIHQRVDDAGVEQACSSERELRLPSCATGNLHE